MATATNLMFVTLTLQSDCMFSDIDAVCRTVVAVQDWAPVTETAVPEVECRCSSSKRELLR